MSWDQIRELTHSGVSFGPHSVSHPILAMEDADVSRHEITQSWARVCAEVPGALPVFCYPNGDARAFGEREERIVADLGLRASLSCMPGYVSSTRHSSSRGQRLPSPLPRLALENEPQRFLQVVSGIDRFKGYFRR